MKHLLQLFWFFALLAALPALADAPSETAIGITPGMEGRIPDFAWKGPALQPAPASDEAPLILRIAGTRKGDDGATLYDLRWMPFVPGDYDLRDLLCGPGGRPVAGLPSIPVHVGTLLPAKHDGKLLCPEPASLRPLSGYYLSLILLWTLWVTAGVVLFTFLFWHRTRPVTPPPPVAKPTWEELLLPLIRSAAQQPLTPAEQARLDALLIAFWRQRLNLDGLTTPEAIARLRQDPDASVLLTALDRWLYAPPGPESADVTAVLAFYRGLPAEATGREVAR